MDAAPLVTVHETMDITPEVDTPAKDTAVVDGLLMVADDTRRVTEVREPPKSSAALDDAEVVIVEVERVTDEDDNVEENDSPVADTAMLEAAILTTEEVDMEENRAPLCAVIVTDARTTLEPAMAPPRDIAELLDPKAEIVTLEKEKVELETAPSTLRAAELLAATLIVELVTSRESPSTDPVM